MTGNGALRMTYPLPSRPAGWIISPRCTHEVRRLARERNAVILAHNYQVPEVQDVADFVGDSLGLAIEARAPPRR